jgi:hypothetical protein
MEKEEMLCQSKLLELGFNKKMIVLLLGEPILKDNPHYKSSPPMKLWKKTEVDNVINSEAFKNYLIEKEKKKDRYLKGVETKRKKLESFINTKIDEIYVKVISKKKLEKYTIESKMEYDYSFELYVADNETLNRWMVNYIRHNLTEYDDVLYDAKGKVGIGEEYTKYKIAVLDKIKEVYPYLSEEVELQKNRTLHKSETTAMCKNNK